MHESIFLAAGTTQPHPQWPDLHPGYFAPKNRLVDLDMILSVGEVEVKGEAKWNMEWAFDVEFPEKTLRLGLQKPNWSREQEQQAAEVEAEQKVQVARWRDELIAAWSNRKEALDGKKRRKVQTVSASAVQEFDKEINKRLRQGWTMHGNPWNEQVGSYRFYYQMMVKE
jgi:hypothetical protein